MLTDFFLKYHTGDLMAIIDEPDDEAHYSVEIQFIVLMAENPQIAKKIISFPRKMLPLCDESAIKAQTILFEGNSGGNSLQSIKRKIHARINGAVRTIKIGPIGSLVYTTGTVVRMSQPTVWTLRRRYSCKKCDHETIVRLNLDLGNFPEVTHCESCKKKCVTLVSSLESEDSTDRQELKIQERTRIETRSTYSVGMKVVLLDDLIDKCVPGDDVEVSGVMINGWGPFKEGTRLTATQFMLANRISVLKKVRDSNVTDFEVKQIFTEYWKKYRTNSLLGRNKILMAICPQLFGMYTLKLALAVILAGGVFKVNQTGVRIRGEPHLLLIGDPGTGKSQILRSAAKLAPRSVLTTGIGTTAAGLTAAAVKDGDGWHLEPGALVLADGGVCCVDEFSTMNSNDRAALHEAMEQQTISIAKAGLVSTLNCRCSVIAALNPTGGKFVDGKKMQTTLGQPLLSRFDLILYLKDARNPNWDRMTSDHIVSAACESDEEEHNSTLLKPMDRLKSEEMWSVESLREYFSHVHSLDPTLSKDAEDVLSAVFKYHRRDPDRPQDRTTVRLLDSLTRLAEGHARLMCKTEVDLIDAIIAAQLVGTIQVDTDVGCPFPRDPKATLAVEGLHLLRSLNLGHLIPRLEVSLN